MINFISQFLSIFSPTLNLKLQRRSLKQKIFATRSTFK